MDVGLGKEIFGRSAENSIKKTHTHTGALIYKEKNTIVLQRRKNKCCVECELCATFVKGKKRSRWVGPMTKHLWIINFAIYIYIHKVMCTHEFVLPESITSHCI